MKLSPLPPAIFDAVRAEGYEARRLGGPLHIPYDPFDAPAYFRAWLRGYQAADADITGLVAPP